MSSDHAQSLSPDAAAQWRARIEHRLLTLETEIAGLRGNARSGPVIHIRTLGNIANRMIQYMAALSLQARLPGSRIASVHLPEWGIKAPPLDISEPALRIPDNRIDFSRVLTHLAAGAFKDVHLLEYLQHVDNFLDPEIYRAVFSRRSPPAHVFAPDEIVVSLRMEEVLTGLYPFYALLPVAFYQDVVRTSGLRPAFFGQLTPSPYLDALRAAFPEARFIAGREPMEDFEVLRSASNLCLSVSTFSWTAAFLSEARRIVIPVNGLFSRPACRCFGADHDLMPRNDPRYDHWIFPVNFAVRNEEVLEAHRALAGRWRHVTQAEAVACMSGANEAPRNLLDYFALYDETFYLGSNKEVAKAVANNFFAEGKHHFGLHGFGENRRCFDLDVRHYAATYPDAAEAVGFGCFRDFHHYHAARGAARGYLPVPPAEARAAA